MAWTYSGDPETNEKDMYRFYVGDTDEDDPILQDEEIEFIISEYPNHTVRLYLLFDRAAGFFARQIKRKVGPIEEDPTSRMRYFSAKALYYQRLTAASNIPMPKSTPIIFRKGMHDNV